MLITLDLGPITLLAFRIEGAQGEARRRAEESKYNRSMIDGVLEVVKVVVGGRPKLRVVPDDEPGPGKD